MPEPARPEGRPGDRRTLDATSRILLGGDVAWRVVRGDVLVLAVPEAHPRPKLACSLSPPSVAFPGSATNGDVLVMAGVGDAEVEALAWRSAAEPPGGAAAVDEWVIGLCESLPRGQLPVDARTLEPGVTLSLGEASCAAPAGAVAWVEVESGSVRLDDLPDLRADPSGPPIPVAPGHSLAATENSIVLVTDTEGLLRRGHGAQATSAFTTAVAASLTREAAADRAAAQSRAAEQMAIDRQSSEAAVRTLGSAIGEPERAAPLVTTDPLVAQFGEIARFWDIDVDVPDRWKGSAEERVRELARRSGCLVRRIELPERWWQRELGPLLAFRRDDGAPVALLPGRGRYEQRDGDTARGVSGTVADELDTNAYVFSRSLPAGVAGVRDVLRVGLVDVVPDIWRILLLGAAVGIASLLYPIATGVIFNDLIPLGATSEVFAIAGGLVLVVVAAGFATAVRGVALLRVRARYETAAPGAVWNKLVELPVGFFRRYTVGELTSRALSLDDIRKVVSDGVVASTLSGLFALFNVLFLISVGGVLAIVGVGLGGLLLAGIVLSGAVRSRYVARELGAGNFASSSIYQLIRGITKLRVAGAEQRAFNEWVRRYADERRFGLLGQRVLARQTVLTSAWLGVSTFGILVAVSIEGTDPGTYLAFSAAYGQVLVGVTGIGAGVNAVVDAVPYLRQLEPILAEPVVHERSRPTANQLRGRIDVSHVTFRYTADGPLVLDDVSLPIAPGELLAITGTSGSGKSTLLRILLGFEEPERGSVAYDGQDLANLDAQSVRRQLGVVLQDAGLLSGTVFSNIAGGLPLTKEQAWAAARMAGIADDIEAMPMGLETIVAEDGGGLSGGQAQRLVIARALASGPRILVLDEATSALDNATQAHVADAVASLRITRVVVAHRLSTIRDADRIVVLEQGRVGQIGTYDELVDDATGPFRSLVARQRI